MILGVSRDWGASPPVDMQAHEISLRRLGYQRICGIDEAGRGPLAGPVVAAAVILPFPCPVAGIRDSKQLSATQRETLDEAIRQTAIATGIGIVDHETIDKINILKATLQAMQHAIQNLADPPDFLLIDAVALPEMIIPQQALIHGDRLSISIAAASILAKVTRDRLMCAYHRTWPHYRFDMHKGYGTRVHLDALLKYGPSPMHRKTFRGVKEVVPKGP